MSEEQVVSAPPRRDYRPPEFKGVGGWLAFFCGSLLILSPIGTVLSLAQTWTTPGPDPTELWIGAGVQTALAGFGIYVGLRLVELHPHAVRLAKIYLFLGLGLNALASLSTPVSLIGVITGAAWLAYFYRSRRVRETYAPTPDVAEVFS